MIKQVYQKKQQKISAERRQELDRFVQKINTLIPSEYQDAIFEAAKSQTGTYIINAGPGAGKTTTGIKLSSYCLGRSVYFAFNKRIQDDTYHKLRALRSKMHAYTTHAFGKAALTNYIGYDLIVDKDKYSKIIEAYITSNFDTFLLSLDDEEKENEPEMAYEAGLWSRTLIHYAQATLSEPDSHNLRQLVAQFQLNDINPRAAIWPLVCKTVERSLDIGLNDFYDSTKRTINFDDMVNYAATILDMPIPKYDHIVIDEAQDLNKAQLKLISRACHSQTQIFAIGDPKQSIFAFTGADHASFYNIKTTFNAQELPLLVCYRCGTEIINLANQLGGQIIPAPGAHAGKVEIVPGDSYLQLLKKKDAVISRTNAPLVKDCLKVLQTGQRAIIIGKEIGQTITAIVDRIEKMREKKRGKKALAPDLSNFADLLEIYEKNQIALLAGRKKDAALAIDELTDKTETAHAFFVAYLSKCLDAGERRDTDPQCKFNQTIKDFREYIEAIFEDDQGDAIQFMTAHKSKGLEFERVFVITTDLFPHPKAKTAIEQTQEEHLMYVTISRAMNELYFVNEAFSCLRLPGQEEEEAVIPQSISLPEEKQKHPGGRPRKDRVRVNIKLTEELQKLTENLDRSQLIIDLLNRHFHIEE